MSDKVLFWLDAEPTAFCIAYYLKKIYNADFFAVIDITNRPKHFFKNQNLVEFKKMDFEEAVTIAQENGLTNAEYIIQAEVGGILFGRHCFHIHPNAL